VTFVRLLGKGQASLPSLSALGAPNQSFLGTLRTSLDAVRGCRRKRIIQVSVVNAVPVAVDDVFGTVTIEVVSIEVVVNTSPLGRDPVFGVVSASLSRRLFLVVGVFLLHRMLGFTAPVDEQARVGYTAHFFGEQCECRMSQQRAIRTRSIKANQLCADDWELVETVGKRNFSESQWSNLV
jgi:hypothetical protein